MTERGSRALSTRELIFHQGFDFRGDNDSSRARAAKFFMDRVDRDPSQ
ncbi:hypothetical protein [Methylocystis borbori]